MASRLPVLELVPRPNFGTRLSTRFHGLLHPGRVSTSLIRGAFLALAAFCDLAAICFGAVIAKMFAPRMEETAIAAQTLAPALIVAMFFLASNLMRNEYEISRYVAYKDRIQALFLPWNVVFLCTFVIIAATRSPSGVPVASLLLFYASGLFELALARMALVSFVRVRAAAGTIAARRVLLIGYEDEIETFSERYEPWRHGIRVSAASVLRGVDFLKEDLALASAYARILRPDDIFILVPWSHKETIDACINAFLRIPASIHLGPERVLDRFSDAQVSKIGPIASLNLVHRPLTPAEVLAKRVLDVVLSATALIALAPLLVGVAIAIKCDSKGPAIFRQRRYGFNQEPFRIFKFRSMTTMEDGATLVQVTKNDDRITRVGRFIRRFNIDELPQLLNVLRGEMSLVGPRPHALAHDQHYERNIGLYARRHNVKPGITGWAQVNGWRGGTSDEMIRQRIAHDLYYIDNWSLLFDIQILWLTVTSKKAYRNAY